MVAVMFLFWLVVVSAPAAWSATYYTTKSGSDANSCASAQTIGTAKLTVAGGLGCLQAGDTLIIGNGTYVEVLSTASIPGTATESSRITIQAQNRRQAIIAPGGANTRGLTVIDSYITIEGLVFNCSSTASGDNAACLTNNVTPGINGVWILDNEFYNGPGGGMLVGAGASNWIISKNAVHDNGWATDYHNSNGLYLSAIQNSTISRNDIYHNECNAIRFGNSTSGTHEATDNIAEHNYIHDNGDGFGGVEDCGSDGAGIMIGGQRNTARYNLIINQYRAGIWFYSLSANVETDNKAYNNTIYNVSYYGIAARANVQNSIAKNNHIAAAGLAVTLDQGTGTVFSNNRTTGVITDCTVSTSDFTQKAGSACIDAGVDVGLPFNGSAPDIGAFETFVFASCEVPFTAPGTIQITFTSNVNLLGSTLTTFTARRNGSNNALTGAATKIGDTIVSLPLTATYVGGDTVDISWSSGGLTDNALNGNSVNQPFRQTLTNQSCTNNAGGAPAFTFTQAAYRFHGVYGAQATPDVRSVENAASFSVPKGAAFRVRFALVCSPSDCASTGFYLRYATGGGYTLLPDAFASGNVALCGTTYSGSAVPADGAPTTALLSTGGTFVPGAVIFTASAVPTVTLANGNKTELEYCIRFDTDATGTYTFRLYKQTGEPVDVYTVTPSVTLTDYQANMGF